MNAASKPNVLPQFLDRPVRWGILGAGGIAPRFATSLAHVPNAQLVAISCRSEAKAQGFAQNFGVDANNALSDETLGGIAGAAHEALLARPDIDAIYLALPHGLHHDWAIRALHAGKAVLCEKPTTVTPAEMEDIAATASATNTFFMEAMKTRFTPLYQRVKQLVDAGAIGEIERMEVILHGNLGDRISSQRDYLSDPVAGGVLLDMGIYCVAWLEDFLPGEPSVTSASAIFDTGVDRYVNCELAFGEQTAHLIAGDDGNSTQRLARIIGTTGIIEVDDLHRPQRARLLTNDAEPIAIEEPYQVDDFYGEIAHVNELIRTGARESGIMPLAASLRCASIIAAIKSSLPDA